MTRAKTVGTRLPQVGREPTSGSFAPGCKPGPGRPKGSKDRLGLELVDAIHAAAHSVGEEYVVEDAAAREAKGLPPAEAPPRGKDAYLARLAKTHPPAFVALLVKTLPTHVTSEPVVEKREYKTLEEVNARLEELGVQPQRIYDAYPHLVRDEKKTKPDDEKKD
jgi:hypothetical protein